MRCILCDEKMAPADVGGRGTGRKAKGGWVALHSRLEPI
jgi:hypothetical protein